jgi:hypothetical protein
MGTILNSRLRLETGIIPIDDLKKVECLIFGRQVELDASSNFGDK